jgi:N utilization substance protein B
MGIRRKSRELVVQTCYALEYQEVDEYLGHLSHLSTYSDILTELSKESDVEKDDSIYEYADFIIKSLLPKIEEIDNIISKHLGEYKIGKIGKLDLIIIRLACFELLYESIPPAVVINEAIDLAKKYCAEKSPALVNALLDKIKEKEVEANEE